MLRTSLKYADKGNTESQRMELLSFGKHTKPISLGHGLGHRDTCQAGYYVASFLLPREYTSDLDKLLEFPGARRK